MELGNNKQIFNLWDTNGRRADVLNAIEIYLNILVELREEYPDMAWGNYPNSLYQYLFYQKAIEASPEVFKNHAKYDQFSAEISIKDLENGVELDKEKKKIIDEAIEQRARHYTSNLVRLGFARTDREITPAGQSYYNSSITKDQIEEIIPISTTNLLILRQLLKFRTYTKPDENGRRNTYSPLFMALYILLSDKQFDKDDFKTMVQSLTPYKPINPDDVIEQCKRKDYSFAEREFVVPPDFLKKDVIEQSEFEAHITNAKSSSVSKCYYEFYKHLYNYRQNPTDLNFERLKVICCNNSNSLKQAFGNGNKVFDFGRLNSYDHKEFKNNNYHSPFLITNNFNRTFYTEYTRSKIVDQARENSDTTSRLFAATGLISLSKALPQLIDSDIYECIFDINYLKDNIFTVVTQEEYEKQVQEYETNLSLSKILKYSSIRISDVLSRISSKLGKDRRVIKKILKDRTSRAFENHIKENYPIERVSRLLKGFSDIDGGIKSRDEINPSCGIPTAFEYIVAIAWYYVSDVRYDLYSSMNLTMGADFEPERFAPKGTGDIVAEYEDIIVMLEVTMMNAQAQKRGEWEPVLRHSVNLRVDSAPKDAVTIFIANELDYNTINIWRAVAMVPLKSSNSNDIVNGVAIMPITSVELSEMLDDNVKGSKLISTIKSSYSSLQHAFDDNWRNSIILEIRK